MKYVKKDFNQKYRQVEITHRAEFSIIQKKLLKKKAVTKLQPLNI